jgi:AraC-like DNA-binding protein
VWHGEGAYSYAEVKRWAPLIEESFTPLSRGPHDARGTIVSSGDVSIFDSIMEGRSIGVSVVDPAYLAFVVPISHEGEYVLNGAAIPVTGIHLLVHAEPLYVRGGNRRTLGILLPEKQFVETVAALTGVAEDSLRLSCGLLRLPTVAAQATRDRLLAIRARSCLPSAGTGARRVADEVFDAVVDAFLRAGSIPDPGVRRSAHLAGMVRRAEDRFMAAAGARVSLADLCKAAGVGSTALYEAFERVCGESPLAYLRKRQLMRARLSLMRADRPYGAVKRAALDAGLTHLGRFALEYRELFGESPSTTLTSTRSCPAGTGTVSPA